MSKTPAPEMPLMWLRALISFSRAPSMEIAAKQLGLSQPALSKQLRALEQSLNLAIFLQQGKRKVLTDYGRDLVTEISPRFEGLADSLRHVELRHQDGSKANVILCARREILDRIDRGLTYPGRVRLVEAGHEDILSKLMRRECDLGITHEAPDSLDFQARPLFRESFQLLVPKNLVSRPQENRLAQQLVDIPFVAYKANDEVLESAARFIGLKLTNEPDRVTDNYGSLFRMIEASRGWGVVPSHPGFTAQNSFSLKLPPRAIQGREFRAIFRKELSKARWMKDLLTDVTQTFTS